MPSPKKPRKTTARGKTPSKPKKLTVAMLEKLRGGMMEAPMMDDGGADGKTTSGGTCTEKYKLHHPDGWEKDLEYGC